MVVVCFSCGDVTSVSWQKKKQPCKFPCVPLAADGSQTGQKKLDELPVMGNENEHAAAKTTRIFLHLPHAQVTSCASWTCDISKCHCKWQLRARRVPGGNESQTLWLLPATLPQCVCSHSSVLRWVFHNAHMVLLAFFPRCALFMLLHVCLFTPHMQTHKLNQQVKAWVDLWTVLAAESKYHSCTTWDHLDKMVSKVWIIDILIDVIVKTTIIDALCFLKAH